MRNVKDPRVERAHTVDIHVGIRVRTRRKAIRISQQELARQLQLTFQQVQKYERGSNRISASKLYEISKVLQVPVAWFFEGLEQNDDIAGKDPQRDTHAFLNTNDALDLGEAYLSIPTPTQRVRMLDLMRAMASEA